MGTRLARTGVDISSKTRGAGLNSRFHFLGGTGTKPDRPFFFRLGLVEALRPLCPMGVFCTEDEERRECGAELGEGQ